MRIYTVLVTRNQQVLFEDDIPFFSAEEFSRLVGSSLEEYRRTSGINIHDDDVTVVVLPKHAKPS